MSIFQPFDSQDVIDRLHIVADAIDNLAPEAGLGEPSPSFTGDGRIDELMGQAMLTLSDAIASKLIPNPEPAVVFSSGAEFSESLYKFCAYARRRLQLPVEVPPFRSRSSWSLRVLATIIDKRETRRIQNDCDGRQGDDEGSRSSAGSTNEPSHSADFTFVDWFGVQYQFTPGHQAEAVKRLWCEFENGGKGLSEKTIGELIGSASNSYRLAHTFRGAQGSPSKKKAHSACHPAFGKMIQSAGRGIYRLVKPESQKNHT